MFLIIKSMYLLLCLDSLFWPVIKLFSIKTWILIHNNNHLCKISPLEDVHPILHYLVQWARAITFWVVYENNSGIGVGYLYYCSFSVTGWHLQKCWNLRQSSQKFQERQFSSYCEIFTGGNGLWQITVTMRVTRLLYVPSNSSFLVI